ALGLPVTGQLDLGAVAFWPQPLRITDQLAQAGAQAGAGVPVLRATGTDRVVTVALDPSQQTLVRAGNPVQVTLPDGTVLAGRVSSVSRVATTGAAGLNGPGGNGPGGGPGGNGQDQQASITPLVRLTDPRRAGALDQAPVLVAITQEVRRHVLAVPVAALLARAGGGYAVAVLDGGRHEVPVRPGLYDELAGLVEVTGAGLAADQTVEVPAS